jgi:hypothetical protein
MISKVRNERKPIIKMQVAYTRKPSNQLRNHEPCLSQTVMKTLRNEELDIVDANQVKQLFTS